MTISRVSTQLRTTNLDESIRFYVSTLGFELAFRYEDFYAGIRVGDQEFHLKLVDTADPSIEFVTSGEHFHLYFTTDDVEKDAANLADKGVRFLKTLNETPWGTREFSIQDDQGHVLYYGQRQ